MDLDQALHIERDGDGYVVHYAIADVAAFVDARATRSTRRRNRRGRDAVRRRTRRSRCTPRCCPRAPRRCCPTQDRPALLWTIEVDADGRGHRRRRRARAGAQPCAARLRGRAAADLDAGHGRRAVRRCSREVGRAAQAARGGPRRACRCRCPSRRSTSTASAWTLEFRQMLPVEEWNAQISLLTGMAAASLMVYARVGAAAHAAAAGPARRAAAAPHRQGAADRLARRAALPRLHPRRWTRTSPSHAAMIVACTRLLRGSGYVGFDGETPEQPEHAALASEYAHVTAPLRRLGDRYAGEVCVALCAGTEVPSVGARAARRAAQDDAGVRSPRRVSYERAVLDLVEAAVLRRDVGEDVRRRRGRRSTRRTRRAATSCVAASPPSRRRVARPGSGAAARCRRRGAPRRGRRRRTRTVRFEL